MVMFFDNIRYGFKYVLSFLSNPAYRIYSFNNRNVPLLLFGGRGDFLLSQSALSFFMNVIPAG